VARRPFWIGRDEIVFSVGVFILLAMTVAAVILDRQSDATLVAAAVGLLGFPLFASATRKDSDDRR
jgi:hypothetical protein